MKYSICGGAIIVAAAAIIMAPRSIKVVPISQASRTVTKNIVLADEKKVSFASPLLLRACSCESWGSPDKTPRQFNPDGTLLVGVPLATDWGACQINSKVWSGQAKILGYDLRTYDGNVSMANYLYRHQGMQPWSASKACWQT